MTAEVDILRAKVRRLEARIHRQRLAISWYEDRNKDRGTYWQRRAWAAEAILLELGDQPLSATDRQPMTAYWKRRYEEVIGRLTA